MQQYLTVKCAAFGLTSTTAFKNTLFLDKESCLRSFSDIRSGGCSGNRRIWKMARVAQHDCMLPSSGLRARIFYPAFLGTEGTPTAQFFPASQGGWTNENAKGLVEYLRLPKLMMPVVTVALRVELPWQADAAPAGSKLPLVLFSHGLGGSLGAYVSVCHDIAATGRVVVAIEHADGSATSAYVGSERTRIPYKRVRSSFSSDDEFHMRNDQLRQRVAEFGDVLDDMRKLSKGEGQLQTPLSPYGSSDVRIDLKGLIDPEAPIMVAGHSFGACTALAFASAGNDVDVEAVIALDPWLYPMGPKRTATADMGNARVLFVDQENSGMRSSIELRRSMPKPSGTGTFSSVKVLGGGHNNASDFATRLPRFVATQVGLTAAGSDPEELMRLQNRAVVAFLDKARWERFLIDLDNCVEGGIARSVLPECVDEK